MNALQEIAARKQMLLERSNDDRNEVARTYYRWQARTHTTRQVARVIKHPVVLALLGLAAWKLPWRRGLKMGGWLWKTWKIVRVVRRLIT